MDSRYRSVRLGRPTFLRDVALSAAGCAALAVPVAIVVAATGFPEWGEVLFGFFVIFALATGSSGLGIRLVLHGMYEVIFGDADSSITTRAQLVHPTLYLIRFAAGCLGAAAVLLLAFLLGTGELPGLG